MRSLTARFFAALVVVSVAALALGTWWVRRAVDQEISRNLVVMQTVENIDGVEVVRETRRELPAGPVVTENLRGPAIDVAGLNRRLLVALSVVVFGAALVTALVARRVLGPVRALRLAVDKMAAGAADVRVDVSGHDELASLGRAFNTMADTVARQEQLRRDLTNDIAHELRTPLTDLRCHLEALEDRVVSITPDTLRRLQAEVSLQRMVEDLGELARADARQLSLTPELVRVKDVVDHLVHQAASRAAALHVEVRHDATNPDVCAWVDRGRLQQVVGNLVDNALVHTPAGGVILVSAGGHGHEMVIRVTDSGPGIAEEHLPHIFDRFYRVDPSRSRSTGGVGLGLAIARQFVEASGGRIEVTSVTGEGTTFSVYLPSGPPT